MKTMFELLNPKLCVAVDKNHKIKNKMPSIINDLIKNNLDVAQENSYKHVYRKKNKWELWRLSLAMMGIEIVYAVVTAFVSPLLLMYGMRRDNATFVWAVGPLFGLIFSPLLGSLSDRCEFSIGRRRPFIIFLTTLDIIGLILLGNSNFIGHIFGDKKTEIFSFNNSGMLNEFSDIGVQEEKNTDIYFWTVILIVIGTILVDFSTDTLLNPCRAYALDVCVVEDHGKVLSTNTVLSGLGAFVGYIIGWVDWGNTILFEIVNNYVQVVFYIVASLLALCVLANITIFKEIPLKKLNSMNSQNREDLNSSTKEEKIHLKDYLKTIVAMPYSLKILWITNFFCWMSHVNYYLYFTHFVGSAVFGGDPSAPSQSPQYQLYENGIRFGCIALSANSITGIFYSFLAPKIINIFGIKQVYVATILLDAVCLMVMAVVKSQIFVIILSAVSGIIYCTSFTIPYMLVAHYHAENVLDVKNKPNTQVRGLGTDLSIIGSCICMAQFISSLIMGKMTSIFGVSFAVIGSSSILSFMAAVTASQIVFKNS